jgi:hypothetical protein
MEENNITTTTSTPKVVSAPSTPKVVSTVAPSPLKKKEQRAIFQIHFDLKTIFYIILFLFISCLLAWGIYVAIPYIHHFFAYKHCTNNPKICLDRKDGKNVCYQNQCVECATNSDCPANKNVCDASTNTCQCSSTIPECLGLKPICFNETCIGCNTNSDCARYTDDPSETVNPYCDQEHDQCFTCSTKDIKTNGYVATCPPGTHCTTDGICVSNPCTGFNSSKCSTADSSSCTNGTCINASNSNSGGFIISPDTAIKTSDNSACILYEFDTNSINDGITLTECQNLCFTNSARNPAGNNKVDSAACQMYQFTVPDNALYDSATNEPYGTCTLFTPCRSNLKYGVPGNGSLKTLSNNSWSASTNGIIPSCATTADNSTTTPCVRADFDQMIMPPGSVDRFQNITPPLSPTSKSNYSLPIVYPDTVVSSPLLAAEKTFVAATDNITSLAYCYKSCVNEYVQPPNGNLQMYVEYDGSSSFCQCFMNRTSTNATLIPQVREPTTTVIDVYPTASSKLL